MKTTWIEDLKKYVPLPDIVVVILLFLVGLGALAGGMTAVVKASKWVATGFRRWRADPDEQRRGRLRAQFARHLYTQLERLNDQEEWRDQRYAELEAEVEAEGRRRRSHLLHLLPGSRRGSLRREPSLSKALVGSAEEVVLLEGEPGAGKSVALRHVAYGLADTAKTTTSTTSLLRPLHQLEGTTDSRPRSRCRHHPPVRIRDRQPGE